MDVEIYIGLMFEDGIPQWVDPLEEVNYAPRWHKVNGNGNEWPPNKKFKIATLMVNQRLNDEKDKKPLGQLKFQKQKWTKRFVACSRYTTCWNFDTFIEHATVSYTDTSLVHGTVATITCGAPYKLNGKCSTMIMPLEYYSLEYYDMKPVVFSKKFFRVT